MLTPCFGAPFIVVGDEAEEGKLTHKQKDSFEKAMNQVYDGSLIIFSDPQE